MEARALSPAQLLDVWEHGCGAGPIERAVTLLGAIHALSPATVLRWPVGVRDARLLAFRARTFGPDLEFLADCPHCGETAEADLPLAPFMDGAEDVADLHHARLGDDDVEVTFRAVTSEDVLHALACDGERTIIERCLVAMKGALDDRVEPLLAGALAAADPLADVRIDLSCPACGQGWSETLDPPSFVWHEIDAWAKRMLHEVDVLARAYGWSEHDILSLGPARRAAYMEMLA